MPSAESQPFSLRDQFAAQILPAMLIAPKEPGVPRMKMDQLALAAYEYADAMLRARGTT